MRRVLSALTVLAGLVYYQPAAAIEVGTALVLAIDVSSSVDDKEYELQRTGIVKAFTDPAVVKAIWNQSFGRMAVTVVEWSHNQTVVVPWMIVEDEISAHAFAAAVSQVTRASSGSTLIGDALIFANALFATCPCTPSRRVIDVSGDGISNGGAPVEQVRDEIIEQDVTINGLAILADDEPTLEDHYRGAVTGGPGHFVIAADGFSDFARALRHKLVLEIAAR